MRDESTIKKQLMKFYVEEDENVRLFWKLKGQFSKEKNEKEEMERRGKFLKIKDNIRFLKNQIGTLQWVLENDEEHQAESQEAKEFVTHNLTEEIEKIVKERKITRLIKKEKKEQINIFTDLEKYKKKTEMYKELVEDTKKQAFNEVSTLLDENLELYSNVKKYKIISSLFVVITIVEFLIIIFSR